MANEITQIEPRKLDEIWRDLPDDGKKLAIFFVHGRGLSQGREILEAESQDQKFDLDKNMKELLSSGLLQQVTLIEEKREQLARMPKPREIMLTPLDQIPPERLKERVGKLTDSEREYFRLTREIEDYERNREKQPAIYKGWDVPRYRLSPDFQAFIEKLFSTL